jgi:gliding motility-associated-like protein
VGNPNFSSPLNISLDIIQGAREVAIADLNGDGKPEIVVANSATNDLYIFKNESTGGTLNINTTPIKVAVTGAVETLALELQDMDGDGKTDIIATRNQSQDIFILKNTSTLSSFTFSTAFKITVAGQLNDLATADFNSDGKLDIIATSLFTTQALVLFNKSTTTAFVFDAPKSLTTDAQPFGIDISDLNGDRFPDFIIANRGTNTLNAYLHNGNNAAVDFTKVTIPTGKTNWFVRAGDLDGDAKPDIAFTSFTGPSTFSIDILRNKNCHKPQILNIPPLTLCPSQTIRLTTIPIPGVTFDWSNGFSSIKNSADPFADVTVAATYTVTAKGEGTACSVTSAPMTILSGAGALPADPVITTNAPICSGTALTLSTPTVSGATYAWTGPNNFTSSLPNISIPGATINNAGNYSLTIKVGDCSSNTVIKRVDIVSFGSFAISSSNVSNTICQGQNLTLTINSEPGYSFQWMKDGANITGQTSATLNVTQGGSYKVKVTNTLLSCSQETAAVVVTVFTAPIASFTLAATGCVNQVITFTSTSTVDANATKVFAWAFGDTNTSASASTTHTYTTSQTFNPQLTVSYSGVTGCTNSVTKSINIVAGTTPVINASKSEICPDETATLSVAGTFNSFLWNTNATTSSIDVTSPGDYSVTTVDANGCEGSETINIATKTLCTPGNTDLEIPLVFTPNGDSQNDRWVIPGVENKGDCTMNVFDGRGRRIFQKTGYPIDGWDGTYDGKEVPEGTYYYVFSCPNETPVTGSVLVVR